MSLLNTYNTFPSFKVFGKEIRPIEHKGGITNPSKKQQILWDPQEEIYLQVYLVEKWCEFKYARLYTYSIFPLYSTGAAGFAFDALPS